MSQDETRTGNLLLAALIPAVIIAAALGHYAPAVALKFKLLGDIFLRLLFMLVVPLVMASMIAGIVRLAHLKRLGRTAAFTLAYYVITTVVAVITGLILVSLIKPGKGVSKPGDFLPQARYRIKPAPLRGGATIILENEKLSGRSYGKGFVVRLLDQDLTATLDPEARMSRGKIPVLAFYDREGKKAEPRTAGKGVEIKLKERKFSFGELLLGLVPQNIFSDMAHDRILPLIFFSLLLGAALATMGEPARPLIEFTESLNLAVLKLVRLIMFFAPLGVFGLVAARMGKAELELPGGFAGELSRLGFYAGCVIAGLVIHAFVTLPLLLRFAGKRKVLAYSRNLLAPFATAFSTASSAATLPLTMEAVEERNRVSGETAGFVLPLGATINMDGTALYEAVAAVFIAQAYGVALGPGEMIAVALTATLAAIGAAAIPEAGLVTMVMVLKAAHLPVEGIALILAIDWFLDRCRTTVNVWGDAVAAAVVERFRESEKSPRD